MVTHEDLTRLAIRHLYGTRRCRVVVSERGGFEIPDALGWHVCSILIECKTSMGDFYADQKKPGRREATSFQGLGCERYYLTPPGLLKAEQLPPRWGLLEAHGKRVYKKLPASPQPAWNQAAEARILLKELAEWHYYLCDYERRVGHKPRKWEVFHEAFRWRNRHVLAQSGR